MTDERPNPPTSRRMNPLAWLIIAIVVVLAIIAAVQCRGRVTGAQSGVGAPLQEPAAPPAMPNQPTINDRMAGESNTLGNQARQANPSPDEPGGNMTTGGGKGQGGANTTGAATRGPT
jgi:hypothetical protein